MDEQNYPQNNYQDPSGAYDPYAQGGYDPYVQGGDPYGQYPDSDQQYSQQQYESYPAQPAQDVNYDQQYPSQQDPNYDQSASTPQMQGYPDDAYSVDYSNDELDSYSAGDFTAQKPAGGKKERLIAVIAGAFALLFFVIFILEMGLVGESVRPSVILGISNTSGGYETCKENGGTLNEEYPYSCTDVEGNIFFQDSSTSEKAEGLELNEIRAAKEGFVTLKPDDADLFRKEVVGENINQLQVGLTAFLYLEDGNKYYHEMVINNINLPSLDTEKINLLEKVGNYIETGDGYEEEPQIVDAFNYKSLYSRYYSYYLGEVNGVTYEGVDAYRIVYTLDASEDNMRYNAKRVSVKVFAKLHDNYIMLEKSFEPAQAKDVEKTYIDECFLTSYQKGEENYETEKQCYLAKVQDDDDIPTEARIVAQELVEKFKL